DPPRRLPDGQLRQPLADLPLGHRLQRRPVVGLRLPGRTFRAVREGALLAPDRAVGRISFEDYLSRG
ncbi:hypothetical protein ACSNOC_11360, partial [Streptomyces sp. URMC 129]